VSITHPTIDDGRVIGMVQQGQVLRMKSVAADGTVLWGYRYRAGGRNSRRLQKGGFLSERDASEALEATQALRQVLARAVAWGMIDVNPAKVGVDNPQRRRTEKRPFESWGQLAGVASRLDRRSSSLVMFAAATGLRPGEWIALEWRDVDPDARVVYVRRAFRNGRIKFPKTEGSIRAVPLQTVALNALKRSLSALTPTRCFRRGEASTSTSTTSGRGNESPRSSRQGSRRSAVSAICDTPSRRSRSALASRLSTSHATWEPA
jgi:integrase